MRRVSRWSLLLVATALLGAPSAAADGDNGGDVVVTVGSSTMTVAELQRRLSAFQPFQLTGLGKTPEEVKKNFIDTAVLPEMLYAEEARRRKLEDEPGVADRLRDVYRAVLQNRLEESIAKDHAVTIQEIKQYYDENKERFNTPRRIKIWRILVADEATAKKMLDSIKAAGAQGLTRWGELSRKESLDKATGMRDGTLGFVEPDGKTDMPEVRVDPALFAAADKVKDGELVPDPVKEGERWALIWRRGSMEAVHRSVAQEEKAIRQVLMRKKREEAMRELLERLEKEYVKDENPELLKFVEVSPMGDLAARQRPGIVPRGKRAQPAPRRTPNGLR